MVKIKKDYIYIVLIWVFYFLFLTSVLFIHDKYKEFKQSQRLNITELQTLSKEEILTIIKERQQKKPVSMWEYIFIAVAAASIMSTLLTSYYYYNKIRGIKANLKKFLKLLPNEERIIIEELINKNVVYQSEISEKLGKVKAHRLLKNLESRGIIKRYKVGKTYVIRLTKDIAQLFK